MHSPINPMPAASKVMLLGSGAATVHWSLLMSSAETPVSARKNTLKNPFGFPDGGIARPPVNEILTGCPSSVVPSGQKALDKAGSIDTQSTEFAIAESAIKVAVSAEIESVFDPLAKFAHAVSFEMPSGANGSSAHDPHAKVTEPAPGLTGVKTVFGSRNTGGGGSKTT